MFAKQGLIRWQKLGLATACFAVLGLATASMASTHSVLLGNFEDGTLDGFGTDGGPGGGAYSQGTTGTTLGSHSLTYAQPQGAFWGPATMDLVTAHRDDLINATQFIFDMTLNSVDLNGGAGSFDGFAQSNELGVALFGGGGSFNVFAQMNSTGFPSPLTDSKAHGGQYAGDDGTRTLTWDLTKFKFTDPADGLTKTLSAIVANHPEITDATLFPTAQVGNATAPVGPALLYFDNVRLTVTDVPEPVSLGLLGCVIAPVLVARRRRNA